MAKSVVIIGAGIAGLAAGCYARMNGYRARILEMHDKAGGLCTAWKRGDYTFDGCLEWLVGAGESSPFHAIWGELGALEGTTFVHHEAFTQIEDRAGKALVFYTDPDRLERHMNELSPADADVTASFVHAIRHGAHFPPPPSHHHGLAAARDWMHAAADVFAAMPDFARFRKTTVRAFAERFRDPFLRGAFADCTDLPDFPLLALAITLGWHASGAAAYPIGGSLPFAAAIERRFLELGGEISYGARVERILVVRDRVTGVKLTDGRVLDADFVVSAADGFATIFRMLGGAYASEELRARYRELPRFPSLVRVSFGVARDLSAEPHSVNMPLAEPLKVGDRVHDRIALRHYAYDPTMAPPGKTVVVASLPADYEPFLALSADRALYEAEKERLARAVERAIVHRFPQVAGAIEVVDVATPVTYERITGNWEGSMEGWLLTPRTMFMRMPQRLPGLGGFAMAGQWVQPGGGVPTAAMTARRAIHVLCREDRHRFAATSTVHP